MTSGRAASRRASWNAPKHQLRARLVFESDSGTNIAHQLGYFRTIGDVDLYHRSWDAIAGVTLDAVARVAASRLRATNRTVGWFKPTPAGGPESS